MKVMDPSELVKQPQDVTENPFNHSAKDGTNRQKTSFGLAAEEVTEERFSLRETIQRKGYFESCVNEPLLILIFVSLDVLFRSHHISSSST